MGTRVEAETEEARRLSQTTGEKNNLKMPLVEEVQRGSKCLGPWVEEFQLPEHTVELDSSIPTHEG